MHLALFHLSRSLLGGLFPAPRFHPRTCSPDLRQTVPLPPDRRLRSFPHFSTITSGRGGFSPQMRSAAANTESSSGYLTPFHSMVPSLNFRASMHCIRSPLIFTIPAIGQWSKTGRRFSSPNFPNRSLGVPSVHVAPTWEQHPCVRHDSNPWAEGASIQFSDLHRAGLVLRGLGYGVVHRIGQPVRAVLSEMESHPDQPRRDPVGHIGPNNDIAAP